MLIRGLIKKVCSWPFKGSADPQGAVNWVGTEREDFYKHINNREYSKALQIIKNKATRYSLNEMEDLMNAFERDVIGGQIIVIEKIENE